MLFNIKEENGKVLGRPKGTHCITDKEIAAKRQILKRARAFVGDLKDIDCIKIVGVSKGTYYKYKKELLYEVVAGIMEKNKK